MDNKSKEIKGGKKMKKRKVVIIPTIKMKLAMTSGRYLPNYLYIIIASFQQKKKQ